MNTTGPTSKPSEQNPFHLAQQAAGVLKNTMGSDLGTAVILGSGWSQAVAAVGTSRAVIPSTDLPGNPAPTVAGHSGTIHAVETNRGAALLVAGRSHLYEGHNPATVVHLVRACVLAGCERVILTNAAGSLVAENGPGTPVVLRDQLNLTGTTPMLGADPPEGFPGRFCDVTELYSASLRAVAQAHDPTLPEGVYAGLVGGAYETPAEITMLRTMGADLVGMSTVLESIAAKHLGAEIAGVSLVTNLAAGMQATLSHGEVLDVAAESTDRIVALIVALMEAP